MSLLNFRSKLIQEVSVSPLITFRLVWGIMLLFSVIRFASKGWIYSMYIKPDFFFPFIEGVRPLPGVGMYVVFYLMGIAALGIFLGFFYRVAALSFFLLFTYVELLDKTNYLNHYYFVSLVSFILIFLPAHGDFSLDVKLGRKARIQTVPFWNVIILRLQLGIVYFYAGIAKINPDWMWRAQPLKIWLASRTYLPLIGSLLKFKFAAYVFSWFGLIYDLSIPFLLSIKRTLPYAYAAVIVFHIMTWLLFPIGMFPFIMIAATTVFFPVSFHDRLLRILRKKINLEPVVPALPSATLNWKAGLLGSFLFIQLLIPFRYLLYPGNLFWNEEGFRFSWRVMLMEKSGAITFKVQEGDRWELVDNRQFLTGQQEKMMSTQPDMIVQFAQFLGTEYQKRGFTTPEITAESYVSLNGRSHRVFVKPEVNLLSDLPKQDRVYWIAQYD